MMPIVSKDPRKVLIKHCVVIGTLLCSISEGIMAFWGCCCVLEKVSLFALQLGSVL